MIQLNYQKIHFTAVWLIAVDVIRVCRVFWWECYNAQLMHIYGDLYITIMNLKVQ